MQTGTLTCLAAESDAELEDWMKSVKSVINLDNISQKSSKTEGNIEHNDTFYYRIYKIKLSCIDHHWSSSISLTWQAQ